MALFNVQNKTDEMISEFRNRARELQKQLSSGRSNGVSRLEFGPSSAGIKNLSGRSSSSINTSNNNVGTLKSAGFNTLGGKKNPIDEAVQQLRRQNSELQNYISNGKSDSGISKIEFGHSSAGIKNASSSTSKNNLGALKSARIYTLGGKSMTVDEAAQELRRQNSELQNYISNRKSDSGISRIEFGAAAANAAKGVTSNKSNNTSSPALTTPQVNTSVPASTSSSNNTVLQMNYEELTNLKQTISALAKDIDSSWKDIMNNKIPEIQSSWAGSDAQAYIDKVKAFDSKVMAATNALELLSDTFEKAANQLQATQADVTRDVNAI